MKVKKIVLIVLTIAIVIGIIVVFSIGESKKSELTSSGLSKSINSDL